MQKDGGKEEKKRLKERQRRQRVQGRFMKAIKSHFMPWCISTLKLALGLFLAVSLANVAAVAASDVAIAVGVAVVVDFFVLFINLICSHKPWQQKDQVSVVSAHCTKPTLKLVASILWRILMAAHVLISYTLLFSPIVVAVWAFFFNNLSRVFLHYTKVYYLIYIGALGDNKTRHSRAQFGLVIVSSNNKTPST